MSTPLTFDIASRTACAPLICGVDNYVVIQLKSASAAKSHDGSGWLVAPITAVARIANTLTWRYTVTVADSQIAEGQILTSNDVWPRIGCISLADSALFAKNSINANRGLLNWQTVQFSAPVSAGTTDTYMFRRATGFQFHAIELGMENPPATVSVQLQATVAGGTVYSNIGGPAAISPSAFSARVAFSSPITVPANAAVRARITGGSGIYSGGTTVDLHIFTSEIP
jgi:hypothetical protein